ncbi:hypothetical protein E2C01_091303 [Portunus trituberculatus]|uniref:Uncharacterized protein n=1 Tax=Portunus trituberculatus TaxID=210409 RepID=A0A5B7JP12_PORTR|nr:hypothetical protein [Portunus trituberculatus]
MLTYNGRVGGQVEVNTRTLSHTHLRLCVQACRRAGVGWYRHVMDLRVICKGVLILGGGWGVWRGRSGGGAERC